MNIEQVWPEWHEDCVLGEGSFGKVYRVRRKERDRVFYSAVKVLSVPKSQQEIKHARAQGMDDDAIYSYFEGFVDDLLNEIILMDNLKGANNIVGIDDYKIIKRTGEIGWDIYIRMELLTPFDSFVSNPDFSQLDVIKLGVDLCSALEMCERNNIVHRDIKPDNIFVSKFGEYKLGDFGIARQLDKTNANLSRKGTLNYMAPEVYRGDNYGKSVDLYSLGLVLYTLLNNNRIAFLPDYPQPITFKDNEVALTKRLSGEPLKLPCNAAPSLGSVIVKACAFRPEERYQNATEFKNALIREWNFLSQSGTNTGVMQNSFTQPAFPENLKPENTTNDMTVNGKLLVDELNGGTTVLPAEEVMDYNSAMYQQNAVNNQPQHLDANASQNVTLKKNLQKSNKFCRILSIPVTAIILIVAIWGLTGEVGVSSLFVLAGAALTVFMGNNRVATGIAAAVVPLLGIIEFFVSGKIEAVLAFDVYAILIIVAFLLELFGDISMFLQKEARLGGTLNIYGAVAFIGAIAYSSVTKGSFSMPLENTLLYAAFPFALLLWSYGYKSKTDKKPIDKILQLVPFLGTALAVIFGLCNLFIGE